MERLMAPAGANAYGMGKAVVAGASAFALGSLCYYGLGLSNERGAIDTHVYWSETVRQRIRSTYAYFGGSILATAVSAVAASSFPPLLNFMTRSPMLAMFGSIVVSISSLMICMRLPYTESFGTKHLAWLAFASSMGASICPLVFLGGPLLARAAAYTAGIVGGLSTLAVCAPSEKFLYMGGPLAMGLGAVIVASIGSMFVPATTVIGSSLYSISLYGGLVLFGGFVLYDTQHVIHRAERHPYYSDVPFDPINACLGIYMDTVNIFIRIVTILASGNSKRK